MLIKTAIQAERPDTRAKQPLQHHTALKEDVSMGPGISTKYAKIVFSVMAILVIIAAVVALTR